jgi:CHAP domain
VPFSRVTIAGLAKAAAFTNLISTSDRDAIAPTIPATPPRHAYGPSDTPFLGGGANAVDYLSILQPGCIVVWDKDTPDRDGAGHVALVTGVDDTHVYVVEQDWSSTGRATLDITASGIDDPRAAGHILGWLTPVFGE